ncbi:MAG TPA: S8 family serine peptidase [Candidatus Angelobacter sp.]|nr:S8 family serine peptidase [Candidatus Angelobacter sp.]
MKIRNLLASFLLTISLGTLAQTTSDPAQQGPTLPVIVVFHDYARFDQYRNSYHPDERAQANPAAWTGLDPGVAGAVENLEANHGFRAHHIYSAAIRGFSAHLTADQIAALKMDSMVAYIEVDRPMTMTQQVLPWGIHRVGADVSSTQAGNGSGTVSNVNVYVIDTGVDKTHPDLNVVNQVNFAGGKNTDCQGHGTHVAGIMAARDNAVDVVGVAPGAPITGVKVLDCTGSGTTSDVIKGVDWVTANAVKPAIANMSLSGGAVQALDDAVIHSADSGVFYSIAAGNLAGDACLYSPARAGTHDGVMTVAATDSTDHEAWWSNYGSCVDVWAPGVDILSTLLGGGTTTKSGTSMAAPHVGGTGALYLSSHPNDSAAFVEAALKASETFISASSKRAPNTSKDGRQIVLDNASTY